MDGKYRERPVYSIHILFRHSVRQSLDERANYQISNLDTGEQSAFPGKEVVHKGMSVIL